MACGVAIVGFEGRGIGHDVAQRLMLDQLIDAIPAGCGVPL